MKNQEKMVVQKKWSLLLQWVVVTIVGWAIGFAAGNPVGLAFGGGMGMIGGGSVGIIAIAIMSWLPFWIIAGLVWALLQTIILRQFIFKLKWWSWPLATMAGGILAGIGSAFIAGFIFGIGVMFLDGTLGAGSGALFGFVGGTILGIMQWFVLLKHLLKAWLWILANALGGMLGGGVEGILTKITGGIVGGTMGGVVGEAIAATIREYTGYLGSFWGMAIGGFVNGIVIGILPAVILGITLVWLLQYPKNQSAN